jgi:hypothetical protein|tara:strand:+ start:962 stop:1198 length:237 start_codon:yes stop_codon:yes gene_type:complete
VSFFIIFDKLFVGKKPPEEIKENAKFNESKVLIENKFNIIKITKVIPEYIKNTLIACLNISDVLNEKKFVNVFLKFSS